MAYLYEKYSAKNELEIYDQPNSSQGKVINRVLLGTWLGVVEEKTYWYRVITAGPDGWVLKSKTTDHRHLKVFYVDVGQGDGMLIEIGKKRILIDGGPNNNLYRYLTGWQYSYLLKSHQKVHIDEIYISHFDYDHFKGIIPILEDTRFTFGTIYHNGIARFQSAKKNRPAIYDQQIGQTAIDPGDGEKYLLTTFDSLADLSALKNAGGLMATFNDFVEALEKADSNGKLGGLKKLSHLVNLPGSIINGENYKMEVLGPVPNTLSGTYKLKWLESYDKTINGHSLVLKLIYGKRSLLLGGDLNTLSEEHLMDHYGINNPFSVDVAKSCHHGSSDFTVDFLKKIKPRATVISSGDNETHSHPRADAIGCAGKYSRGVRPKVYSTELARSINSGGDVLYGMINLRCDGNHIHMSQMKEAGGNKDIWDSYYII